MGVNISVIIPLYNSEDLIRETLSSLICQSYTDFEVILVDDYSTDDTLSVVEPFIRSTTVKFKLFQNTIEKGLSNTLNLGLSKATGKYIAYTDHDDLSLPDRFNKQFYFLEKYQKIGVCGTWMKEFDQENDIWTYPVEHDDLIASSLLQSPIANPTAMYRRELLQKHGITYNQKYDFAQDFAFWLDLATKTRFQVIPEVLVMYRVHSGNASTTRRRAQYASWERAFEDKISNKLLGKGLNKEELHILYNIKYPDFKEYYLENKERVDKLVTKILDANQSRGVFSQKSLQRLFKKRLRRIAAGDLQNELE